MTLTGTKNGEHGKKQGNREKKQQMSPKRYSPEQANSKH